MALNCTALSCTELHCTALDCRALHCSALSCTAPYFFLNILSKCLVHQAVNGFFIMRNSLRAAKGSDDITLQAPQS